MDPEVEDSCSIAVDLGQAQPFLLELYPVKNKESFGKLYPGRPFPSLSPRPREERGSPGGRQHLPPPAPPLPHSLAFAPPRPLLFVFLCLLTSLPFHPPSFGSETSLFIQPDV